MNKQLKDALNMSMLSFKKNQKNGELPDHFIIYRDGVGDAMRKQVMDCEVSQLKELISEVYNTMSKPKITVIIVNKRISQRFFTLQEGQLYNPPSGCIVDTDLVEGQGDDNMYDFFLVP